MADIRRVYRRLSVSAFGWIYERVPGWFDGAKKHLVSTGSETPLKVWACTTFMNASMALVAVAAAAVLLSFLLALEFALAITIVVASPVLAAAVVLFSSYMYPIQKSKSMKNSIETDLPFAMAHMSAIASSGIPPEFMFDMLTDYEEYGDISGQAKLVMRNIRTFGMSSVNAINEVAARSPSDVFKQVLTGMTATIEKGGDLVEYINQMADKAMFDYRMKRDKYIKTLSTYADIYTALLVAAPLMMLSVLGIMSLIGGTVLGMTVEELISFMTWIVLPALNICFIAFVHMTYPGV